MGTSSRRHEPAKIIENRQAALASGAKKQTATRWCASNR
jgi:hypothetical protein